MAGRPTIEDRIAVLESKVESILGARPLSTPLKDWRKTIGRFAGDELMKQIDAEGRKIRASDREAKGK